MTTMSRSVASTIYSSRRSRGLCIIVTNDYRGSQSHLPLRVPKIDGQKMEEALKKLDFTVHWEKNIEKRAFKTLISDLRDFPKYPQYETGCVIFVFCGHGDTSDTIYLQDSSSVRLKEEVIDKLLPGECRGMGVLQRLFFIDSCRGEEEMKTVLVPKQSE